MITKEEALKVGRKFKNKLKNSKGWKINVWENLGWHCSIDNGPLSLGGMNYGADICYCLMTDTMNYSGTGSAIWGLDNNSSKNPNIVLKRQVTEARKVLNRITKIVETAEKIMNK